jgi:hypothetical protein
MTYPKYSEDWLIRELNPELLDHFNNRLCWNCNKKLPEKSFRNETNKCCIDCSTNIGREKRKLNPIKTTWERAKARAKLSNIEFSISMEDVKAAWTDVCPIYNIPLVTNIGKAQPNSHSIDRIDNTKGYIPGNIAIVSMKFNTEKGALTPDVLRRMLAYMEGRLLP